MTFILINITSNRFKKNRIRNFLYDQLKPVPDTFFSIHCKNIRTGTIVHYTDQELKHSATLIEFLFLTKLNSR